MTPSNRHAGLKLKLAHLYPEAMDLYGDGGNVVALRRRCEWRGIELETVEVKAGQAADLDDVDLIVMGGGQDTSQSLVAEDLSRRGPAIRDLIDDGAAALVVCGGFQLFGRSYETADGDVLPGIGVFDAHTVASEGRMIGNVAVETRLKRWGAAHSQAPATLVGFENHSGLTHLGAGCDPLGEIVFGAGNLGDGASEGAVYRNAIGTYLHGPLLPKNPQLADHLVHAALSRRHGLTGPLMPLADDLERRAHEVAVARCRTGRVAQPKRRLAS